VIEQLVALAKIADIDAEALRADTELKDIPARLDALWGDVKKLSELLEAERVQLADADRLLQAQEDELNHQKQALAKSKAKSAQVRNTREADAVERELDSIRRSMKEREAERDTLRGAIEKRKASFEKHATEFAELERYATEERTKADERVAALNTARDQILAGRSELAAVVPADVMRRYEMIRSKRQGIGVAAIKEGMCSGCFVMLTPQLVIAIQRSEEFAQCPRCQRILYSPETIAKHTDGRPST
jgi:predicted  nucleic acid-binding Zn-ribbon protein